MSGYLLDTNIISDIIRNPTGLAARRIEQTDPKEICTSIIVAAELRYGCARKGSARLLAKVEAVLETIPVLPLDVPADAEYGGIRSELESAGQTIGLNDLLIGAHAYALGLLVLSGVAGFLTWGTWWCVLPFAVYGVLYAAADHRAHELSHGTPFRTRWINEVLYA